MKTTQTGTATAIKKATATTDKNKATELIKRLEAGYPIRDKKTGVMIGIETKDGKDRIMISDWEHEVLAIFENVRFRTPRADDPYLRFIESAVTLARNGNIMEIPGYWRRGVWITKKLVTVTYRMAGNQIPTKSVPLGVEAVGKVKISERRNSRTGEVNLIVDYYFYPSPIETSYEVKIGGKKRENTVFPHPIPGTEKLDELSKPIPHSEELIVVNKIG